MSWVVVSDAAGANHVIPIADHKEHQASEICWCRPTDDEGVWVHHSMDRREEYERGERVPQYPSFPEGCP